MSNPHYKKPLHDQLDHYLGPGVWVDKEGGLHYSIPDILEHFDMPDTHANRVILQEIIERQMRENSPEATIIKREDDPKHNQP